MRTRISRRHALLAATAAVAFPTVRAQAGRNIELVVPFVAGQAPDAVARGLAEGMSKLLNQTVVVVNKPGAGGAIGYKHVRGQRPDGSSLVLSSNSISTGFHGGMMDFDYTGFDNIARVTLEYPVLAVRADVPLKDLKEVVAYCRQNPGKLRIGSTSIGSHMHLTSLAFFGDQQVEVTHVPFATSGHVNSLLGGHIDGVVTLPGSISAQVKAGQIRVLGALASSREPVFGDVPTATEQGIKFQSDLWRGIAAPKGTPRDVLARLEDSIRRTVTSPEFKQLGDRVGFQPAFMDSASFTKMVAQEDQVIAALMKKNNIQVK
ncbi:MAG TPA: tripartite tricarboxylate transporter substrate binding protein [Ramlibacter sp.]|nr:tripartite tricarboxylate transporter substrate binding protein [Ramlibacter sp.]